VLALRLGESATRRVLVRCDDAAPHGAFVAVLDDAKAAGAAGIAVVAPGRPGSGGRRAMKRRYHTAAPELITKVNVTPIIDVALVLVIILLVTAPLISVADLPVNLPQAHTREAEDQRNVSITLGSAGELAVDDKIVAEAELAPALAQRLSDLGSDVLVVIRADADAPSGRVRALDLARAAGAKRLAIATRQKVEATP
jgi:biopolymer transport protein ExbD